MDQETKTAIDVVAVSATTGSVLGWLPPLAAALTIVWTLIRIYETDTIKELIKKYEIFKH
jgi:hypothetical protein|tara:strand:+ start:281 stop:460 length:180 start_codon:yes stop_codon:yes gene_type:complete